MSSLNPNKSILLIEDDLFIRELYARSLRNAGYIVIEGHNGEEGLSLSNKLPDLILLDVILPKMHGMDVLAKIKQNSNTKNIPVLLLTNLGEESIIRQAFRDGIQCYLEKSRITPSELVEVVKKYIANPSLIEYPEFFNKDNITIDYLK